MNKKIKEIIEALEFMGKMGDVSKIAVDNLKTGLEELDEQLTLTDVRRSDCEIEEIVEQNKDYVLGFYTGDELKEYLSNNYA